MDMLVEQIDEYGYGQRLIGDVLVEHGVISVDQLQVSLNAQRHLQSAGVHKRLGDILCDYAFATHNEIERSVREHGESRITGFPADFPASIISECQIKLIGIRDNVAVVGVFDELSVFQTEAIVAVLRNMGHPGVDKVEIEIVDRAEVLAFVRKHADIAADSLGGLLAKLNRDVSEVYDLGLVMRSIFSDAIQARASDLHIDRVADPMHCKIQYRIDGTLSVNHLHFLTPVAMSALVTRIKLDSNIDPSDMRHPQDGRMTYEFRGRRVDLRVASQPVNGGETLTIRLLDPSAVKPLSRLFAAHPPILERMRGMTMLRSKPNGLVLVSGPTGSGKTTLLNAMIKGMPRTSLNIMTAEDPVEIAIPHVRQTSVNEKSGVGYSEILRSQMRQDVDVLLVGEIRDSETAEQVLRSTESGHLVLSTLHTKNVPHTISRVVSMVPDEYRESGLYTLAHNLRIVFNQRLSTGLCICAKSISIERLAHDAGDYADELRIDSTFQPRAPVGCARCNDTGYMGRVAVPEAAFFPNDAAVREQMEQILLYPKNEPASILAIQGVEVYSRMDAVRNLIRIGSLDVRQGLAALDRGFTGGDL